MSQRGSAARFRGTTVLYLINPDFYTEKQVDIQKYTWLLVIEQTRFIYLGAGKRPYTIPNPLLHKPALRNPQQGMQWNYSKWKESTWHIK
jgi:hypothetical protein